MMKILKGHFFFALLFVSYAGSCQSKLFVAGGVSAVFGSGANVLLGSDFGIKLQYPAFDFEYERRVIGSFSVVTGVSYFANGYDVEDDSFSSTSLFTVKYVGVPLLARWNMGNKNFLYFDFGLVPYYMVDAHLTESISQFGNRVVVTGDIAPYSNRFYYGGKVQMLFVVNRFYFGWFVLAPPGGQSTLKDLQDHWGLNAEQSTYLLSNGFSDYLIMGLKLGVRIR